MAVVSLIAAYTMLIVLVCPDIPTPIYVQQGKQVDLPAVVAVPAVCGQLVVRVLVSCLVLNSERIVRHPAELIDLTCTRLC